MPFLKKLATPWLFMVGALIVGFIVAERGVFGVFVVPLQEAFHITRAQATLPISFTFFTMGATQPIAGIYIDRFGARKAILTGIILLIFGLAVASRAQNLWQLTLAYGLLVGLAGSTIAGSAWAILIGSWFKKERRATMLGATNAAWRMAPMFFGPFAIFLIARVEWHGALLVEAALAAAIALPVAFFLVQEVPTAPATPAAGAAPKAVKGEGAFLSPEVSHALKSRFYWLLIATWVGCGFESAIIQAHLPALGLQFGLSKQVGAVAVGIFGVFGAAGGIIGGWLSDHFGRYKIITAGYFLRATTIFLLGFFVKDTASYYIISAIAGFGSLWAGPNIQLLIFESFGKKIAGRVTGFSFFIHQIAGSISPILAGFLFDITGSYRVPFALGGAILLFSLFTSTRLPGAVKRYLASQTTPASPETAQ